MRCPSLVLEPLRIPSWRWTLLESSKHRVHHPGDSGETRSECLGAVRHFPVPGPVARRYTMSLFLLQEVRRGGRLGDGTRPSFLGLAPALKKCWLKKHHSSD